MSSHPLPVALIACGGLLALAGCGGSTHGTGEQPPTQATGSSYSLESVTPQQRLVAQGARLIVADGCAACHLPQTGKAIGPNFNEFAGHTITLADGRRVLVDEQFLREALLDPRATPVKGYDPLPMRMALQRLHLSDHPAQVAALAAFVEQIGPEG